MRSCNAMIGPKKPMRARFIKGINSVLKQLKSADLCKFVVKFGLRQRHKHRIDRWVNFCAASRTKHVVFYLCPGPKGSTDTDDRYSFPLDMFNASGCSYVKHLRLGFVSLTLPSNFCEFKHLKKLCLHKVSIIGELQCLLPECSVLEWLSITLCRLVGLSISQQLSRLLFLRVKHCRLQELHVHAPKLTTFEFADHIIPIVLDESLNISEATIELFSLSDCFDYVFSNLINAFSQVQSLSINFKVKTEVCSLNNKSCLCGFDFHLFLVYGVVLACLTSTMLMFQMQGFVKNPSRMTYLRRLVLKVDISGWPETSSGILRLAYLLELAPVLEDLVLHVSDANSAV